MPVARLWRECAGRELFQVSVAGARGGELAAQSRAAIEKALEEIGKAGFAAGHIVRSRLWARDAAARTAASDVRRALLAGEARGASASFFDAERMAAESDMAIDILALRAPAAVRKIVVEYDPPITPPLFVVLDGMVFLSGNTDISPAFADQVARIAGKIERALAKAGAALPQVVALSAFVAKSVDPAAARAAIAERLPGLACPIEIASVIGFSASEKLIEIETTATLKPPA
ncbi:MAG: Rid family hydrolase [Alphaproteobacteria bacterium]